MKEIDGMLYWGWGGGAKIGGKEYYGEGGPQEKNERRLPDQPTIQTENGVVNWLDGTPENC